MASIARGKNGNRRIQFVAPNGKRPAIRLGKVSQRVAEAVKFRVEQLLAAKLTGHAVDADTARWVGSLEPAMTDKLARVGLIPSRDDKANESTTLGMFLDEYIAGRTDLKPSTIRHLKDAAKSMVEFFGEFRPLADITLSDADDFRRWLLRTLGENTVRRRCGRAKQFFRVAVRKRLILQNPFGDMKGLAVKANKSREFFVTREMAQSGLGACPDAEWRLVFALSRFGGLRCPSEHLLLRWIDVDWDRSRIRVHSPKTEHHEGGESRLVTVFPELRPHLEVVWDQAEPGTEFVITRYRSANTNLRTQLERIIQKAGLKQWPKLFQNLRATRETELAAKFPLHVVCAWMGNTTAVAVKHYLQVTDADFERAISDGVKAAQIPAQQVHATSRTEPQSSEGENENTPVVPGFAAECDPVRICLVTPTGLEPVLPA